MKHKQTSTDLITQFVTIRNALHEERRHVEQRLAEITAALGELAQVAVEAPASAPAAEAAVETPSGRKMSAAGRRRISEAAKARWAKARAEKGLPAPAPAAKSRKSSGYGSLKESIIAELQKSGAAGVHIKDLAAKLGVGKPNIQSWFFSSTARKVKNITKAGPATYGWKS